MKCRPVLVGSVLLAALAAMCVSLRAQEKDAEKSANAEPGESPSVTAMRALRTKTQFHVEIMPLADFVRLLSKQHKIPFRLDRAGLQRAHVHPTTPISADIQGMPLSMALKQVLGRLTLTHRVVNGVILITDRKMERPPGFGPRPAVVQQRRFFVGPQGFVQQAPEQQPVSQQLRPLLQVELMFAKEACGPTKEQLRVLKDDLQKYVKETEDDFEALRDTNIGRQGHALAQASKLLQKRLMTAIETRLSHEQAARYRSELDKRSANEREVQARALVALLDRELCLSAEQRDAIAGSLRSRWDDRWFNTAEMGTINEQHYLPTIPDNLIEPYLDVAQIDVWESVQKIGSVNLGPRAFQVGAFGAPADIDLINNQ